MFLNVLLSFKTKDGNEITVKQAQHETIILLTGKGKGVPEHISKGIKGEQRYSSTHSDSFTPQLFYPHGKKPWYSKHSTMGVCQCQSGHFGEQKCCARAGNRTQILQPLVQSLH
jgi:hypothetical protein